MNDRDKIQALWLTMNALEGLGEDVKIGDGDDYYGLRGVSSRVLWNGDTKQWEASAS